MTRRASNLGRQRNQHLKLDALIGRDPAGAGDLGGHDVHDGCVEHQAVESL